MSDNVKPISMDLRTADVSAPLYCLQNFSAKTLISHGLVGNEEIIVEIKWGEGADDFEQATDDQGNEIKLTATKRSVTIYGPAIIRLNKSITVTDTTASYIDTKGM